MNQEFKQLTTQTTSEQYVKMSRMWELKLVANNTRKDAPVGSVIATAINFAADEVNVAWDALVAEMPKAAINFFLSNTSGPDEYMSIEEAIKSHTAYRERFTKYADNPLAGLLDVLESSCGDPDCKNCGPKAKAKLAEQAEKSAQ